MLHSLYLWLVGLQGMEIVGLWFLGFIIVYCFSYMIFGLEYDDDLIFPVFLMAFFWPITMPVVAAGVFLYLSVKAPLETIKWLLKHRPKGPTEKYTI